MPNYFLFVRWLVGAGGGRVVVAPHVIHTFVPRLLSRAFGARIVKSVAIWLQTVRLRSALKRAWLQGWLWVAKPSAWQPWRSVQFSLVLCPRLLVLCPSLLDKKGEGLRLSVNSTFPRRGWLGHRRTINAHARAHITQLYFRTFSYSSCLPSPEGSGGGPDCNLLLKIDGFGPVPARIRGPYVYPYPFVVERSNSHPPESWS